MVNTIMKRVNQSARSVIGPDSTLRMGEIVIPEDIAKILTKNETVFDGNREKLLKLVYNEKCNFIVRKDCETRVNLKYAMWSRSTPLEIGDVLVRNGAEIKLDYKNINNYELKEGDEVIREGVFVTDLKYKRRRNIELENGDVVERQLNDGDWVIVNKLSVDNSEREKRVTR